MYCLIEQVLYPYKEKPKLLSVELYETFEDAQNRSEVLMQSFIEEYGSEYVNHAKIPKPIASADNDDVSWWCYIELIDENKAKMPSHFNYD